jgi:hypothetical protein
MKIIRQKKWKMKKSSFFFPNFHMSTILSLSNSPSNSYAGEFETKTELNRPYQSHYTLDANIGPYYWELSLA